jgi:Zinc dependent phospholipase C
LRKKRPIVQLTLLLLSILVCLVQPSDGYAVLTHEAIIDASWDAVIRPLLLKRFPNATPEDLKNAHAYAYGGSIIQDLGYYPFGSQFFSDLVHYVRNGDFVAALIRDSHDLNDYAFALGALAHLEADNDGHRIAVNKAVPMLYPKLRAKYGDVVTYDQNPGAHLKAEFGFDVLQVAKGHYAPEAYHDYIGFQVSKSLLEQAFQETYSLDLSSIFTNYDLAVGTFRRGVSIVIPKMTNAAWQMKKDDIRRDIPGVTRQKFIYNLSRSSYEKNWDRQYQKPGFGTRVLAFLISLIPKIGPFQALSFRTPTPEAEKLFMASFNATLQDYAQVVHADEATGTIDIKNGNLDTGAVTSPGQYPLADETYAELVDKLSKDQFAHTSPELRAVLLSYYGDLGQPFETKKKKKDWAKLVKEVGELKAEVSANLQK